jgi:hypothetical protein
MPDARQWLHVRAFEDAAEAIAQGLHDLGHEVAASDEPVAGRLNVVFGAHHLRPSVSLPDGAVIVNLEPVVSGSPWLSRDYLERLKRHRVWDYSARNAEALRALGVAQVVHVPLGYASSLERIAPQAEDIDVLFYGIFTPRRTALLERLAARGWRVHATRNQYGEERDRLIARTRIVLNIHAREEARFEMARCFYLLINGRFVLSESGPDDASSGLSGGIAWATYDRLEERCSWYLAQPELRRATAAAGRALIHARPQAEALRAQVAALDA